MILVYCDHITPRHRFIFDFIFGDILAVSCRLTVDREEFEAYDGPKFSYASPGIPGSLNFQPHPLLGEIGITALQIKLFKWNDLPVFFYADFLLDPDFRLRTEISRYGMIIAIVGMLGCLIGLMQEALRLFALSLFIAFVVMLIASLALKKIK